MGFFDRVAQFMALEPMQERSSPFLEVPSLESQLAQIMRVQSLARPWRKPSVADALGVPAIQRAVTLISNTTGSLSAQAYRNGELMAAAPRVISRPDPFHTPREFYRDMAYQLATLGETVVWIGSRDTYNMATALVVVPLGELTIEANPKNRMRPVYRWGSVESTRYSTATPDGDFVHITYLQEPGQLHGMGPIQLGQPAVSVAVEAQEWAANFYAEGGHPSTIIKSAIELDDAEAAALKSQWIDVPNNVPRIINPSIEEVTDSDVNPQGAQMLEARDYQNGEAARMFGMPGALLEYNAAGSSLTYQNVTEVWNQFLKGCLLPNYLEPIEQGLGDLLPRSMVVSFYTQGLLRADIKTRYEVYTSGITSGVLTVENAQQMEGLVAGNPENAPVPASAPAAVPSRVPTQIRSVEEVRCSGLRMRGGRMVTCGKLLSRGEPYGICPRCKTLNKSA